MNYQLIKNLYKRLQIELINLVKKILLADFIERKYFVITQTIHIFIMIMKYR